MDSAEPVQIKNEPVEPEHQPVTDQRTNMVNQQEMILHLNYSIRDQLITTLNQLSAILQCKERPIPEDAKQRASEKIGQLILLLVNLPRSKPTPSAQDSGAFEERLFDRLTIELSTEDQKQLVSHLMSNQNALQFDQFADLLNLVTANRLVIDKLLDLSYFGACADSNEENAASESGEDVNSGENVNGGEPPGKRQKVEEHAEDRPNELAELKALGERQAEQIVTLQASISELKRAIRNENITQEEASFKFELANVSEFLELVGNERDSERFWCRGIQWFLRVKPVYFRKRNYLGVFLYCHSDSVNWSCQVDYKLILFRKPPLGNFVQGGADIFHYGEGWGHEDFLTIGELTKKRNAYINDDTIVVGVEMKAGPVLEVLA